LGTQAVPNKRRAKSKISSSCAFSAAAWSMDGFSAGNWMKIGAQGCCQFSTLMLEGVSCEVALPLWQRYPKSGCANDSIWRNHPKGLNGNTSFRDPTCSAPWNFGQLLCFGAPVHASARHSPNPPQAQVGRQQG
jgi:hypothetical protein